MKPPGFETIGIVLALYIAMPANVGIAAAKTYIGAGDHLVVALQMDELDNGRIEGWIESVTSSWPDGLRYASSPFSGETERGTFVLLLRPAQFLPFPMMIIAHATTGGLAMSIRTSGASESVELQPNDIELFNPMAARLAAAPGVSSTSDFLNELQINAMSTDTTSSGVLACGCSEEKISRVAEATGNFSVRATSLVAQMRSVISAAKFNLENLRVIDTVYRSAEQGHRDAASIGPPGMPISLRPGLLASLDASVGSLTLAFSTVQWPLNRNIGEALKDCRARAPMQGVPVPPEATQWGAACMSLTRVASQYHEELGRFQTALTALWASSERARAVMAADVK